MGWSCFGASDHGPVSFRRVGQSVDLVFLSGLVARPWESEFGGRSRHGIAYRADAVMVGAPAAARG